MVHKDLLMVQVWRLMHRVLVMHWRLLVLQLTLRVLVVTVALGLCRRATFSHRRMHTGWLGWGVRSGSSLCSYFTFPSPSHVGLLSSTFCVSSRFRLAFHSVLPSRRNFTSFVYGKGMLSQIIQTREIPVAETLIRLFSRMFPMNMVRQLVHPR